MEQAVVRVTLSLIGPGVVAVFGTGFGATWLFTRSREYLLFLAAACALVAIGATVQIIYWPSDTGLNAMISGALYTCGVLAVAEGIIRRSGKSFGWRGHLAALAAIMGLLWYFFYVDRSLIARVYVQNLGYALILLVAALRISSLRRGSIVDKVLFWTLFAFALHFFPRTFFTIGFSAPVGEAAFANSLFWQTLQLSLAVLGAALGMAIFAATGSDLMEDLRRDRDTDHLTGVLNRRGFEALAKALCRAGKGKAPALVICDVDHFKSVNDTYGHVIGDQVLQKVARILQQSARKQDIVGRVGGEEFAIFLPETTGVEAFECAERLRNSLLRSDFSKLLGSRLISASFGVGSGANSDFERLYQEADEQLYQAKSAGRNQTWPRPFSETSHTLIDRHGKVGQVRLKSVASI